MKRRTLVIIVVVVLLALGVAVAASFLHDGLSSRATPGKLETMAARKMRRLAMPANARLAQNPLLTSAEELRDARLHFADHCAICHANDGSGKSVIGNGLYPKPPDLRLAETQNLTDGELFCGGEHGGTLDSWRLIHFIRHLPHLTAAERIEMEHYNPKGPDDRAEEQEENDFLNGATPQRKAESQVHKQK